MLINTHTHIYPDKIAKIIMEKTEAQLGIPVCDPMTVDGLLSNMEKMGVDVSVTFCVAEKSSVVMSANDFLMSVCDNKRLIGLGTIHPDFQDYKGEIERLRRNGIKGIKAHSLFQDFSAAEERMFRIYRELGDDMILYLHAGKDPGDLSAPAQTSPEGLARVLDAFPKLKVVAAHFGGLEMLEESRKHLIGRNLYIDTAWTPSVEALDPNLIAELITEHGSDKVLFATDFPMTDGKRQLEWVLGLPLSDEDKERILWKNAQELFAIRN